MKHLKLFEEVVDFFNIEENPLKKGDSVSYVAAHAIGERVYFSFNNASIPAYVRVIYHTNGKVRYSLRLVGTDEQGKEFVSTIHNVDSVFVKDYPDEKGNRVIDKLNALDDFDNYS